nr:hypothetical protein [Cryobacterium sp. TMS1-13-1]
MAYALGILAVFGKGIPSLSESPSAVGCQRLSVPRPRSPT